MHVASTEYTIYVCTKFQGMLFYDFGSELVVHEIFILEILLAKLWLPSVGEQGTCEQLCVG